MANQRISRLDHIPQDETNFVAMQRRGFRWTIWELLAGTAAVCVALSLPLSLLASLVAIAFSIFLIVAASSLVCFPLSIKRRKLAVEKMMFGFLLRAVLISTFALTLCLLSLFLRTISADDPLRHWEEIRRATEYLSLVQ